MKLRIECAAKATVQLPLLQFYLVKYSRICAAKSKMLIDLG